MRASLLLLACALSVGSAGAAAGRLVVCAAVPCSPKHWAILPRALRSIANQTRPADRTVVVLSHTPAAACGTLQAELVGEARLVCDPRQHRGGSTGANRNIAALACGNDTTYVAYLDADDEAHPKRLETMVALMEEHKADLGIAWDGDFDRCFLFDGNGRFIEGYYIVGLLASALLKTNPGACPEAQAFTKTESNSS